MTEIELKNVSYTYSPDTPYSIKALKNVNLKIKSGEFIGVIGHTGSGKSTLMQLLDGLLFATEGQVLLDGEDIAEKDYDMKKLRHKVGEVFQYPEYQLFEESVYKDVCFGPKNLGLSEEEIKTRADKALKLVDFPEDYYKQSPFFLSGGQKRKAAIAGILAMEPEILILDEPTAGLDPRGREMILGLLKKLNEEGLCIILVSHSMDDVAKYCSRVLVMHDGELQMDAAPSEVFSRVETLRSMNLDIPEAMKITYELGKRGVHVSPALTVDAAAESILEHMRGQKC